MHRFLIDLLNYTDSIVVLSKSQFMFLFGFPSLTLVFLVSVPDFLLGEEAGGLGAGVLSLVAGTARFTRDMAQLRAAAVTPHSSRAEVTLLSK